MIHRSLQNEIISNLKFKEPLRPGVGVTELLYSDRSAFTIVEVISPKRIRIQRDRVLEWSDHYGVKFAHAQGGAMYYLSLRKNGRWVQSGHPMNSSIRWAVGTRQEYRDPHF